MRLEAIASRRDRDLLVLADNLLTLAIRLELFAAKPGDNDRLVEYLQTQILDPELWGKTLIELVQSVKDQEKEKEEEAA